MGTQELFQIVNQWYETGSLSEALKPVVQQVYTELTGDPGERCRTCPSYWNDVLHALRVHLATLGYKSMEKNQKYMIKPDAGFLQVHGKPFVYINKGTGPESASAKYLTDKIAEQLLAEHPDRAEVIVLNPDYEESAEGTSKPTKPAKTAPAKKPTAAEKKAAKEAADAAKLANSTTPPNGDEDKSDSDEDQDEENDPDDSKDTESQPNA